MKTLALLLVLALHSTGLWGHLSTPTKARLTGPAAGIPKTTANLTHSSLPALGLLPIRTNTSTPDIQAPSALAIDTATGTVLYSKHADAPRPIASVTKLVTALVILSRHSPTDSVRIASLPTYGPDDEIVGLVPGETYTVGDLVRAMLIPSGNDAADALALYDAGTIPKFGDRMNAKMGEWGISGTKFITPSGLQDTGNFATAEALAKIATLAMANPFIKTTVALPQTTITNTSDRTLFLKTTNDLLASGQFYGIKTGYTLLAGECFVGLTRVSGHEVVTVVLGASDRFGTTTQLTNWISQSWEWL